MSEYKIKTIQEICEERGVDDEEFAQGLIDQSCETCGYPCAQAGEKCDECPSVRPPINIAKGAREWRRFMHGEGTVHSYGRGYLDPHDRYDKRYLDP